MNTHPIAFPIQRRSSKDIDEAYSEHVPISGPLGVRVEEAADCQCKVRAWHEDK